MIRPSVVLDFGCQRDRQEEVEDPASHTCTVRNAVLWISIGVGSQRWTRATLLVFAGYLSLSFGVPVSHAKANLDSRRTVMRPRSEGRPYLRPREFGAGVAICQSWSSLETKSNEILW